MQIVIKISRGPVFLLHLDPIWNENKVLKALLSTAKAEHLLLLSALSSWYDSKVIFHHQIVWTEGDESIGRYKELCSWEVVIML